MARMNLVYFMIPILSTLEHDKLVIVTLEEQSRIFSLAYKGSINFVFIANINYKKRVDMSSNSCCIYVSF